ncbi:hypothetical protein [Streptomyces sp. NPDC050264]|uniref:hypothetical protein n=1 Tax=Streptomyces sp. NPDC050264 TaxID=3155038 RepID=UPI0034231B35
MIKDAEGGVRAAVLLAGGAPLRSALVGAGPGDWLALDAGVREIAWHRPGVLPEWEHSAPLPVDLTQVDEARLAVALCHRDGRIRQEALRRSSRCPDLLPLIVLRCADWVGPVREHARRLLREALDVDAAIRFAPLILRVGRRDRGVFGVEVLGETLRRASRGRLAALFASSDRGVRRFAYRLAADSRLPRPAELARVAAQDEDTVIQDLCATAAIEAPRDTEAYEDVLPLVAAGMDAGADARGQPGGTGRRRRPAPAFM